MSKNFSPYMDYDITANQKDNIEKAIDKYCSKEEAENLRKFVNLEEFGIEERHKIKCDVCGFEFYPEAKNKYLVSDCNTTLLGNKIVMREAFDCPKCGCQKIVNKRIPKHKEEDS